MNDVAVVIVGAGAAGLAASKSVRAAGRTFVVLEALDRIGGRAWLHAADRNPFYPEAQAAGWTLYHHDMGLDHLWFDKRRATSAEMAQVNAADAVLADCIARHGGDDDRLSSVIEDCHSLGRSGGQGRDAGRHPVGAGGDRDGIDRGAGLRRDQFCP